MKRAEIGPILTEATALNASAACFSRLSQPGMLTFRTAGSFSASHTLPRGAAMRRSPVMSMQPSSPRRCVEPTKARGFAPGPPPRGSAPWIPAKGGALGTRPLVGVRKGGVGRLGCRLRIGWSPLRRAATQPAHSPLPHPNQNGWIPKAPPLVGVQGAKPPAGSRGRALAFVGSTHRLACEGRYLQGPVHATAPAALPLPLREGGRGEGLPLSRLIPTATPALTVMAGPRPGGHAPQSVPPARTRLAVACGTPSGTRGSLRVSRRPARSHSTPHRRGRASTLASAGAGSRHPPPVGPATPRVVARTRINPAIRRGSAQPSAAGSPAVSTTFPPPPRSTPRARPARCPARLRPIGNRR